MCVCVPSASKCVCATVEPDLEHGRRSASVPTSRRKTRRRHHHHHRRHRCDGKDGFESGERQEGILLSSSPLADYVVAAAGPARVCRSPRSPGRYCRERSLPGTKSHPSRGSVIANRQGARPHGICPELHATAASHWKLPVARELLVTRELPSSCVVTNVAGTGTRGRKGDDAGYDVHRALAPSLG